MLADKVIENLNNILLKEINITYNQFEELDYDEQQKILKVLRNKNEKKKVSNKEIVMIGSGENSIFVRMNKGQKVMLSDGTIYEVGLTKEEFNKRLERKMQKVIKKSPIEKIKSLVKKR